MQEARKARERELNECKRQADEKKDYADRVERRVCVDIRVCLRLFGPRSLECSFSTILFKWMSLTLEPVRSSVFLVSPFDFSFSSYGSGNAQVI